MTAAVQKSYDWRRKTKAFDDPCAVAIHERQSIDTGDYNVKGFFRACGEPVYTQEAINTPLTNAACWGNTDMCGVDYDSDLRLAPLTNLRNVQQLFTRPYVANGYRGAGANNMHLKDLESSLLHKQTMTNYKGAENSNEVHIDRFQYLPAFGNPQRVEHIIQPWTRGGLHSRDLVRRISYEDYNTTLNQGRPY